MRHNLHLKLFALAVALTFWYIVLTDTRLVTIQVPIELVQPPKDRVVTSRIPSQAEVKITGPSFLVNDIVSSPPVFRVQVPADIGERFTASLRAETLSLPASVTTLQIEPGEIVVEFDEIIRKMVEVQVPRIGALDTDLTIKSISISPSQIELVGPNEIIRSIEEVETYPVDFRRISSSVRRELELRRPSDAVSLSTSRVVWNLEVSPVIVSRSYADLPVTVQSEGIAVQNAKATPSKVAVEVSGRPSIMRQLESSSLEAYVEVIPPASSDQKASPSQAATVQIAGPRGLTIERVIPERTSVTFIAPKEK